MPSPLQRVHESSGLTNLSSGLERSDMDSAEQLQRLYLAGFELETFDRFPKAIGVLRDGCIAFLVPGPGRPADSGQCRLADG